MYAGNYKCGTIHYNPRKLFYTISCNGHVANNVRVVQKHNWLSLAEVQVFGGSKKVPKMSLLSQGRPTKQNSVGWGGVPQRAVDGNVDGQWRAGTSTHSRTNRNNWWQVDLQARNKVYLILIHNRVDCCQNRLNGAQVYLDKHLCGTIKWNSGQIVYSINCGGKTGRFVKVVQKKNYLTLAEVQVFGLARISKRTRKGKFYKTRYQ